MDFADYEKLFNKGDDDALIERYWADDVVFSSGSRDFIGKAGLRDFLHWAHDGVREVMRPQNVVQQGDFVFAEIDMDFHAMKARSDFPFGQLLPGDLVTVKFFVTYQLRHGRIIEFRSMTWPPEKGVSKLPRLGAHPSQVAAFHAYTQAFSGAEFERFPRFYTEDVLLTLGSVPPIRGRQGIIDFYRPMFERVREGLTINSVEATNDHIALDAVSRFTAIDDAPDFVVGALCKGDYIDVRVLVDYTLRDGLISRIAVRRGGEPVKFSPSEAPA